MDEKKIKTHVLKIWPSFFEAVKSGEKTFELRIDDRGFKAGDVLELHEWDDHKKRFTGRFLAKQVTYLVGGPGFGLCANWVCMALGSVG